ncbi:MAG: succinate dehydrogenase assembly factor 2 [Gammaproteobacteria bacterium]|nr:succinate dehydrogenase assembly factor 2 [Gammaproteobacteria bacterium]CAJ2376331.1 MAG: FAD assembly factor SdhE [Arenicellales bacterium IbO2]MDA7961715.1 succinate dehydrogenase assembly factor 2 [Gammaproteobacteria bacterium]MDA7967453.1 succinate dehydrogenase assembly factor 2 [Gammaproteobacteria bacterium]MDA7969255.1 succinate dehydrogenase assembly factor 2 [Gammaproteobacteria bacterium]
MSGEHKRRLWRCRRGSKELDLILSDFATNHAAALSADEQRCFDRLLDCADPQLSDWLCNGAAPRDPELASLVKRILSSRPA